MEIIKNENMAKHCTFNAGGVADFYVEITDEAELTEAIAYCNNEKIPYFILGKGSNVLFSEKGFKGMVIAIGKAMSEITVSDDGVITAQAGAALSGLAMAAYEHGLSGLEFAGGIPGTVGGGVFMNAGAYGGELKDVITRVLALSKDGAIRWYEKEELDLSYRHSVFMANDCIVLKAEFKLEPGVKEEISAKMRDFNERRRSKQPLEYGSAGSTFKRPEGYFAGALIEQCGLKGYSVGDACVSEKHAGFVVNKGSANADEILAVVKHVQKTVKEVHGVDLELEVRIIGE